MWPTLANENRPARGIIGEGWRRGSRNGRPMQALAVPAKARPAAVARRDVRRGRPLKGKYSDEFRRRTWRDRDGARRGGKNERPPRNALQPGHLAFREMKLWLLGKAIRRRVPKKVAQSPPFAWGGGGGGWGDRAFRTTHAVLPLSWAWLSWKARPQPAIAAILV